MKGYGDPARTQARLADPRRRFRRANGDSKGPRELGAGRGAGRARGRRSTPPVTISAWRTAAGARAWREGKWRADPRRERVRDRTIEGDERQRAGATEIERVKRGLTGRREGRARRDKSVAWTTPTEKWPGDR